LNGLTCPHDVSIIIGRDHVGTDFGFWFNHIARRNGTVFANQRDPDLSIGDAPAHPGILLDLHTPIHNRAFHHCPALDDTIGRDDRFAHDGSRTHNHPRGQHTAFNTRTLLNETSVANHAGIDCRCGWEARWRTLLRSGVDDPAAVIEFQWRRRGEQIHVRLPVGRDRTNIHPITGIGKGEHARL
jgi:hypothetical protein